MTYFDKYMIACVKCGHIWIIGSNKFISDQHYWAWAIEVYEAHKKIHEEKDK